MDVRPPIRVVHVITDLDVGGAERMLSRLVANADPARLRHAVVSLRPPGRTADAIRAAGVPVSSLGVSRRSAAPFGLVKLVRRLRTDPPEVLQSWLYHADLLATLAIRLAGGPALVWNVRCADMDFRLYARSTALVVRLLARMSRLPAAVVVNSDAGRAVHERLGYRPRRWLDIPNGFDLTEFRPDPAARQSLRAELGLAPDALVIGMLARADPMKDHATFLRAATLVAGERPNLHFVLAGRGTAPVDPHLAGLAGGLAASGRLHLLGERADIPRISAALDLATLTSAFGEGFPNVLGEAMACGVPCVATDVGDSARVVGDTGRIVPPRDTRALAAAWGDLLNLPAAARAALGRAARARIAASFSIETVCARYEALYADLARRRAGDAP